MMKVKEGLRVIIKHKNETTSIKQTKKIKLVLLDIIYLLKD